MAEYKLKEYNFSGDIPIRLLASMARTHRFIAKNRDILLTDLFSDKREKIICEVLLTFFDKYKDAPSRSSFFQCLTEKLQEYPKESHGMCIALASQVFDDDKLLIDAQFVRDKAVEWGKKELFVKALLEAGDDVGRGLEVDLNLNEIRQKLLKACKLGEGDADLGSMFSEDSGARFFHRELGDESKAVPTGIELLDRDFLEGGMRPGELFMVLAKYGEYKSTVLCNAAAYAYANNLKVVYYTLEMSQERVLTRIDANLSGFPTQQLNQGGAFTKWAKGALEKYTAHTSDIVVKFYPTKSATVHTLRGHLGMLMDVKGFKPDLVIVDYLGLLRCGNKNQESHQALAECVQELRGLAGEFNLPVMAAHQLNREGSVAGSIEICNTADVVIINRMNAKQRQDGYMLIEINKSRNGRSGVGVMCKVDPGCSLITSDGDEAVELSSTGD